MSHPAKKIILMNLFFLSHSILKQYSLNLYNENILILKNKIGKQFSTVVIQLHNQLEGKPIPTTMYLAKTQHNAPSKTLLQKITVNRHSTKIIIRLKSTINYFI